MSCFGDLLSLRSTLQQHSFQSFSVSREEVCFASSFMKTATFSKPKEATKAINYMKPTMPIGTVDQSNERYEDHLVKGWAKNMPLVSKKTLSVYLPVIIYHYFGLSKALQTKSRVSLFIYLGCCVSQWHIEKLASAIFTCQSDCNLNWQNKLLFTHSHWLCYVPEALGLFFQLRSPFLPSPLFLLQKHNEGLAGRNVTSTAGSSWLGKAMALLLPNTNNSP